MKKVSFEYEIGLTTSPEGNQCIKLIIVGEERTGYYFGRAALNKCISLSKIIGKEEVERVKGLKNMTDQMYLDTNK